MTPPASTAPSGWRVAGGLLASAAVSVVSSLVLVLWPEITQGFDHSSFRIEYAIAGVVLLLAYHLLAVTPGVVLLRRRLAGLRPCLLLFVALAVLFPFALGLGAEFVLDGGRGGVRRSLRRVAEVPLEVPWMFVGAVAVGVLAGFAYWVVARGSAGRAMLS